MLRPSLLATRLFGRGSVRLVTMHRHGALISRSDGGYEIHVAEHVREENREWIVGHELGHFVRQTAHGSSREERYCDCIGACVLMPRAPFPIDARQKSRHSKGFALTTNVVNRTI